MQYPTILDIHMNPHEHVAQLQLHMPQDLIYFEGHFPGFQILPGVVQLDWAIHFACKLFNIQGLIPVDPTDPPLTGSKQVVDMGTNFAHVLTTPTDQTHVVHSWQIQQLKFTKAILPNDTVELQLTLQSQLLLFQYTKLNQLCSLGKIKLEFTHD